MPRVGWKRKTYEVTQELADLLVENQLIWFCPVCHEYHPVIYTTPEYKIVEPVIDKVMEILLDHNSNSKPV